MGNDALLVEPCAMKGQTGSTLVSWGTANKKKTPTHCGDKVLKNGL